MKTQIDDVIFGTLNQPQQDAVRNVSGPILILAGAGSGKTKALTHRIAYLIHNGVPPWQILSVTFTNKAAKEMKERIKSMLHLTEGEDVSAFGERTAKMPAMGTFHSICVRILRRDIERLGRDRSFVIYDGDDQEKLMKQVLRELRIEEAEMKPRAALGYVGRFKSEGLSPAEAKLQATSERMQRVAQIYAKYQTSLREANAMDFDDLILETVRLFQECPDVLDRYQETWRYLHVDEYQDTNHAQYMLISQLAQKYRNICVIGDPDQSIYGFRGADIRNILEFEKEYKDAKRIKLEQNYRSTQPILSSADAVISFNPDRPEKNMWTERKDGPKIVVHQVSDERKEAEEIVKAVDQQRSAGVPLREQVVLYRTHAQSRVVEEACMRRGLPYRILGGVKFYGRKEVKDVLAYLYVILNPYDTISLLRIINVPARKIGLTTMAKLQGFASAHNFTLWDALREADAVDELNMGTKEQLRKFVTLIQRHQELARREAVSAVASRLLEETGMEQWLKDDTDEGEERWHNVQELVSVMRKYDHLDASTSLTSFLEEVALVSEVDKLGDDGSDALTLMTLHLCKGLEFEHVMIAGCEEGLFPHANSLFDKNQLEEERRLMYVGMTRAKTHLRLLYAQNRMQWGESKSNAPSRFLDDLPDQYTERRTDEILSAFAWSAGQAQRKTGVRLTPANPSAFTDFNQDNGDREGTQESVQEGSRVEHPTFGKGTILARRGDVVDIAFDGGPKKTFALSIAPLKLI